MVRYVLKFLFLSFCFGQNLLNETFDNVSSFPYNGWEFIPDPSQYPPNTGEWRISTWSTSFNTTPPVPTYYWAPAQSGSYDHPYSGHYMYSPIINVSDITNVIVSFKMAFDGFPSPEGHYNGMNVEYSSDGTNWIRVLNYEISSAGGDQVDIFPRTESFYATMGQTLQIRWETYGTNSYYIDNWHIDDISVEVSEIYYEGPVWHVSNEGSDETGDGSEDNPYATIQKGVDMSMNGDTVLVGSGTYYENIQITDKMITLSSYLSLYPDNLDFISNTIIDGSNIGTVISVLHNQNGASGETYPDTIKIFGFSLVNGSSNNEQYGNAIAWNGPNGTFNGYWWHSTLSVENCNISQNTSGGFSDIGSKGNLYLNKVTISNSNDEIYGVVGWESTGIHVKNSIIENGFSWYNREPIWNITYTLFNGSAYDEDESNIYGDPFFCDPENGDYSLAENSPAVGAGEDGVNMGALGVGCDAILTLNAIHVATTGSDETGDGSESTPFATIQHGIDAASDGDTVLVHNGQYIENIIFDNSQTGKNIVLGSLFLIDQDTSHISATILDGGNSSRVFDIIRADTTTHITGFTITNGNGGGWGGGGIRCGLATPASPYLSNLVIKENYGYTGGGILIDYESNPGLKNITFDANVGVLSGGAISIRGNCNVILDNIVIKSNQTEESNYIYGGGAGIKIDNNSYVTLRNCLIFNNNSQPNPGLAGVPGAALNIKDNSVVAIDYSTIFGNTTNLNDQSFADQEIYLGSNSELSISNTIIWDDAVHSSVSSVWVANNCNLSQSYIQSGENNINLDPLFCNRELFDFTLAENSPCIESGENGSNIGALGVGCGAIYFNPEIEDIDNQQIEEDGSLSLMVNAVSPINISMTYHAECDTSDVVLSFDNSTLIATPSPNWNGAAHILVMVTDENELSDTTDFTLTVTAVNDPPEVFSVIYPTVSDTFSTHMNSDTLIAFNWEESSDVDSDVTYILTIELEFFGNTYTDVYENITDTTISISSNSLDSLLNVTSQDEGTFTYYVHSSDDEYTVSSDIGEFILSREVLGTNDGLSEPKTFTLHQNYPNPFNPVTKLRYDLPQDSHVRVTVYDMLGNVINNLVNANQSSGYKSIQWDATNNQGQQVSAGVYIYSIEAGDFRQTKKMILLK